MADVIDIIRGFGSAQHSRSVLPELALTAVRATVSGELSADDAAYIYEEYAKRAQKAKQDVSRVTFRVQTSKLKQIMRVAEEHGVKAERALVAAQKLQRELYDMGKTRKTGYGAMIDVARWALRHDRLPSVEQMAHIITH